MNGDQVIDRIAEALKNQRCVIFFGSGISKDSGLPTGKDLIGQLLGLPKVDKIENFDLARTAQIIRHREDKDWWLINRIQNIFLTDNLHPNKLHNILALLNSKYYVTTNYDKLFDKVLREFLDVRDLHIVVNDADIPKADPVIYVKLHGDIADRNSIVLTYDDYETRFDNNPNLLHLLYSLFAQNLVLFVGYSLRDPNILSVVRKIGRGTGRYAKGMYIALFNPSTDDIDFFDSINVHVIPLRPKQNETESDALSNFLSTIWNRTLSFDFYIDPKPLTSHSYVTRLETAIDTYRRASFQSALKKFDELSKTEPSIWRKDPGAFAQYAYFYLKTLDKLNRWAEIEDSGKKLLADLNDFGRAYPQFVVQSIQSQVSSSIGLPLMRATLFKKAEKYIRATLDVEPEESITGKGAMLLYADRHTVLACIYLNLSYFGESRNARANLKRAVEHLDKAEKLYKKYDDVDGENEVHYLGRFFGAWGFLKIAQVKKKIIPFSNQIADEIIKTGDKSYREIVENKNRVPYGKLAGKYCKAIGLLFLANEYQKQNNTPKARKYYDECIQILTKECLKSDKAFNFLPSALEICKFNRTLQYAFINRAIISDNPASFRRRADYHKDLFLKSKGSREIKLMNQKVITDENWIYTPLN